MPKVDRYVCTYVRGRRCVVPRWVYNEWTGEGLRQLIHDFGLERNYANPVEEEAMRNINRFSYALRRFYLSHDGIRRNLNHFERIVLQAERTVLLKTPWLRGSDLYVQMCRELHQRGIKDLLPRQLQGILLDITQKLIDLQAISDQKNGFDAEIEKWRDAAQALLDEEVATTT